MRNTITANAALAHDGEHAHNLGKAALSMVSAWGIRILDTIGEWQARSEARQ